MNGNYHSPYQIYKRVNGFITAVMGFATVLIWTSRSDSDSELPKEEGVLNAYMN